MIAFNREFDPNKEGSKTIQDIQNMLDAIYGTEEHFSLNISEIVDIIYKKIYKENKPAIQIMILKNPNNSLDVVIDNFDE